MVMYGAYFDESIEKPAFSLSGYSGATDTWLHLDWAWGDLLKKWKISSYKASECENLLNDFGQYRDSSSAAGSPLNAKEFERMTEIKIDFIDAICKHSDDLQGYGAVVVTDELEKIVSESSDASHYFKDSPYYICFQLCLVATGMPAWLTNQTRRPSDQVYVKPTFDSHDQYSELALSLY